MSLISPRDRAYRRAKRVKQGREQVPARYARFLDAVEEEYGVRPLDVVVDTLDGPGWKRTRRVGVVLERTAEAQSFDGPPWGYDAAKQARVAELFVATTRRRRPPFVWFGDFERVALQEVHDLTAAAELAEWERSLGLGDRLWRTNRLTGPPIVFVATDAEAHDLEASGRPGEWARSWAARAARHDEFGYLRPDEVVVSVDSRERFDRDYAGNWHHYFT